MLYSMVNAFHEVTPCFCVKNELKRRVFEVFPAKNLSQPPPLVCPPAIRVTLPYFELLPLYLI